MTSHSCPSTVWLRSEGKPSLRSHAATSHMRPHVEAFKAAACSAAPLLWEACLRNTDPGHVLCRFFEDYKKVALYLTMLQPTADLLPAEACLLCCTAALSKCRMPSALLCSLTACLLRVGS